MIGGHGTGPGAVLGSPSLASPSAARAAGWTLRLLLLAVAAGLVLMHHVVGAHQHAPPQPGAPTPAAHASSASAAPTLDATSGASVARNGAPVLSGGAATAASAAPEAESTALLHVHHDQTGHDMAVMLHLCLAVLAAAFALALAFYLTWRRYDLDRERPAPIARRTRRGRPPVSVPLLLAQLQILRL